MTIGVDHGGKDVTTLTFSKQRNTPAVDDIVIFEGHKYKCIRIITNRCVEIDPVKRPSRGFARHLRKQKSALRRGLHHR